MLNLKIRKFNFLDGFRKIYRRKLSAMGLPDDNGETPNNSTADNSVSFNKSGLLNSHRNMLHNKIPYMEPHSWIHLTEKYQRKVFGRYGSKSGVSPKICFGTKDDRLKSSYENFAEPLNLQSMVQKFKDEQNIKINEIAKREEEISKKLEKLNQWKQELRAKILKKEADAIAAKEKKDRLVEEVRRHFGYKIDPKDERFKEVLEKKEKEDKKRMKEAKRKAKEQTLMLKIAGNSG